MPSAFLKSFQACILMFSLGLLAACMSAPVETQRPTPIQELTSLSTDLPTPTQPPASSTPEPGPTSTASFTPTVTVVPSLTATPGPRLCSPLEGVPLADLPGLVAGNTYQTPMPGRDSGHPGIDLAFYNYHGRKGILGLPLQAVMAGRVAAVLPNRQPYGNAVILEVPLVDVPAAWLPNLNWPTPAPAVTPDARLTCPSPLALPAWDETHRSLYLMYGHLNQPSPLKVGQSVTCGQTIGEVGTTGASVNPHLHFETRLGPAGATIPSMGHYSTHTTEEERNNYCVWRVSGWFQVVDPLVLLAQQP